MAPRSQQRRRRRHSHPPGHQRRPRRRSSLKALLTRMPSRTTIATETASSRLTIWSSWMPHAMILTATASRWTLKTWTATAMMISSSTLPPPVATPPLSHHRRRSCLRRWRVHRLRVVPPPGFRRSGQLRLRTGQHRLDTGRMMDAHPAMPGLCQRLHEKGHPDLRRAIPAYT